MIAWEAILGQTLKVVTLNCWSGLDYRGVWSMGEYEPEETRERRFSVLVKELRETKPDVIALQESNPIHILVPRLAKILGYDYILQRTNSGLKIGTFGIPTNLNEGIAILARKEVKLEYVDAWDLSQKFGIWGNTISFHFSDQNIALVGKIQVGTSDLYIINTHLVAALPNTDLVRIKTLEFSAIRQESEKTLKECLSSIAEGARQREDEVRTLSELMSKQFGSEHVILVGDFNATPDSPEMRFLMDEKGYLDTAEIMGLDSAVTWDTERNQNILIAQNAHELHEESFDLLDELNAWYDGISRRIDYVLLSRSFKAGEIRGVRLVLNEPVDGLFVSDHYGVEVELEMPSFIFSK